MNDGVACRICRGPHTSANAREQCGTIRGAFLGGDNLDRLRVDVSLDLPPQRGARAASAEAYCTHRNVELGEDGQRVLEAEGDAFHDGADDVCGAMGCGEPDQSAARFRIKMRCAFAHQIWRP